MINESVVIYNDVGLCKKGDSPSSPLSCGEGLGER
jgi:hypothetical protein